LADRNKTTDSLQKTNRMLLMLSRCNEASVQARSESELLNEICQIIIEIGCYKLAWIGFAENNEQKIVRPVAQKGFEDGYLNTVNITWGDGERGQGPTGKAIRTGMPSIIKNILKDPNYLPWREQASKRGYKSSIALPIITDGIIVGALNVYSEEEDAFDEEEIVLLMRLTDDLAFGITAFRTQTERMPIKQGLKPYRDRLEELVLARTIELEKAHKQLQNVTTEINNVFNISIPICLIDKNYNMVRFNDTFCSFIGLPKEEIIGRKCYQIKKTRFCGIPNCTIEYLSHGNETYEYEADLKIKPNGMKSCLIVARPYRNLNGEFLGVVECLIDITARKKAEEALQKSEEKFKTLFNSASDSITICDLEGHFLEVNDVICEKLRYKREELLKMSINDIYSPEFAEIIPKRIIEVTKQGYAIFEATHRRQDGIIIPIEVNSRIIDYLGQKAVLSIARDITARKKFETLQKQFISTASHELRTPVSVISQSVSNLQKYSDKLTDDQRRNLFNYIIQNSDLLTELVNDLLLLSQVDEQKTKLDWISYSPFSVLQRVLNQLEQKRAVKDIEIEVTVDQNIQLFGDPKKVGEIFRIFIDNSLKYSPNGTKIQVKAINSYRGNYNSKDIEGVLFHFTDFGRGIRQEDLPYLFTRFFRSDEVKNIPGTGLGLPIALNFTQFHGGEIHVESTYGKSTTFFLFLPRLEKDPSLEK